MPSQCCYITHCPHLTKSENNNRMKLRDNRTIYLKIRTCFKGRRAYVEAMAQASRGVWSPRFAPSPEQLASPSSKDHGASVKLRLHAIGSDRPRAAEASAEEHGFSAQWMTAGTRSPGFREAIRHSARSKSNTGNLEVCFACPERMYPTCTYWFLSFGDIHTAPGDKPAADDRNG